MSQKEYVNCTLDNGLNIEVIVIYSSPLMKFIRFFSKMGGLTIWHTVRFFCKKEELTTTALAHELEHVRQWHRLGFFGFLKTYFVELIKHGYNKNALEQEARKVAGEPER